MRVAEGNDTKPGEHCNAGVRTLALLHKRADSRKDILLVDTKFASLLQVIREDVQQKFRVRRGVDMAVGRLIHKLQQVGSVDQISVLPRGIS